MRNRSWIRGSGCSVHAPEVECISKGKVRKRFEFGCKVGLGVTSRGGWVVAAKAFHGNPYDGHTLAMTMDQLTRVTGRLPDPKSPSWYAFVDLGYA